MKKTFIILGVILLIIIGAVWAYLFLYGVPKDAGEVFARFQTSGDTPVFVGNESDTTVDVAPETESGVPQRLRQLTTRPVAGAIFLDGSIRYAERGTGHIYDINLQTGAEKIVSGTTIPKTVRAVFAQNGDQIALTKIADGKEEVIVGTLSNSGGEGSLDGNTLPEEAREVAFTDASSTLSYYLPSVSGGTAYAYNVFTKKSVELFTIPLQDIRIMWGKDTYIYTTPSGTQKGYVYRMNKGVLGYLTSGETGLTALTYADGVIVTRSTEEGLVSTDLARDAEIPVIGLIPEKCVVSATERGILYCGAPVSFDTTKKYPDDWYKGVVSFSDTLFKVDAPNSTVQVLSNLEEESGRSIDIAQIGIDKNNGLLYFVNKNDNALWMFDLR